MSAASDWLEAQILNHQFRSSTWAKVANLYVALFVTDPTDAATGTEVSTIGTGYTRQTLLVNDASWTPPEDAAGYMRCLNAVEIEWADPTGSWGTPSHWALFDAGTSGNMWAHGSISGDLRAINVADDPVSFATGALIVSVGSSPSDYLETLILNHMLRSATWAKPANVYGALHLIEPGDATAAGEFTGTGYGRVSVAVADSAWTAPSAVGDVMQISNSNTITFPTPLGNWGAYQWFAFWDAITGGNMIHEMQFPISRTVNAGDHAPTFPPGTLKMQAG